MKSLEPTSSDQTDTSYIESEFQTELQLDAFKEVTSDYVVNLIKSSPDKPSDLNPMPTNLLKENVEVVAPCISDIINLSIKRITMTSNLMKALVCSLLKKSNLELISKNYRPDSNLSNLSKLTEKTVSSQLTSYTNSTGKTKSLQSAYKQRHSTETTLLKVMTDMLALDNKEITCLVLFDFKCGFQHS